MNRWIYANKAPSKVGESTQCSSLQDSFAHDFTGHVDHLLALASGANETQPSTTLLRSPRRDHLLRIPCYWSFWPSGARKCRDCSWAARCLFSLLNPSLSGMEHCGFYPEHVRQSISLGLQMGSDGDRYPNKKRVKKIAKDPVNIRTTKDRKQERWFSYICERGSFFKSMVSPHLWLLASPLQRYIKCFYRWSDKS